MKKKLLEKDGFYLALFVCVCLVAVGGVWFTKNNVDELTSDDNKDDDEIHFVEENEKETVPTSTESKENLQKAKEQNKQSKLAFVGTKVTREYSEKTPSYSKTLDLWEVHKGLDIASKAGNEVKSLLSGQITDVFKDDEHGMSVKIKSNDNVTIVYSNLDKKVSVKKGQEVKEGQVIGLVGNTSFVESKEESHIHIEAYQDNKSIDPMNFIK